MKKILIIIFAVLALLTACNARNAEVNCSKFRYDECPQDTCVVGPSCYVCEDIGCHPKGYDKDWGAY